MARSTRLCLVIALLVATTACTSGPGTGRDPAPVPAAMQPNRVTLTAHTEALAFEPGEAALAGARLVAFRERLSPAALGRGHLVVVAPAAPGDPLSEERAGWALAALQGAGVAVLASAAPIAAPAVDDGTGVILEIQQAAVRVPACETYPRALQARVDKTASSRLLGCATAANLGLMVADPVDLVQGRSLAPADGQPAANAVGKYRTGGAKAETANPIAEAFAKAFGGKDK